MFKVTESIFSHKDIVIPMADVQNIEKRYHDCDLVNGTKKGDFMGVMLITSHTKWNFEYDCWENGIWVNSETAKLFMKCWCRFRHELELDTL